MGDKDVRKQEGFQCTVSPVFKPFARLDDERKDMESLRNHSTNL